MDFALNEEQLELQEMVRDFVEKEITDRKSTRLNSSHSV